MHVIIAIILTINVTNLCNTYHQWNCFYDLLYWRILFHSVGYQWGDLDAINEYYYPAIV